MKYRALMFQGADEVWWASDPALSPLLAESNRIMAALRQRGKPVDGGEIWCDGVKIYTLKNEHWIKA